MSVFVSGQSSDRTGDRKWHCVAGQVATALFLAGSTIPGQPFRLVMVWLCLTGLAAYFWPSPFWALPTLTLTASAAAVSIGFINMCANLAGYVGNHVTGWLQATTAWGKRLPAISRWLLPAGRRDCQFCQSEKQKRGFHPHIVTSIGQSMNPSHPSVVVTDWTFPDLSVEEKILRASGVELVSRQCKSEKELIDLCADADAVITQFARVNANVVSAMRKARAIVRYGVGVDNIDLDTARERGIPVCNVPDYCIDEVADQTLAFILATTRQVVTHANHLRAGQWGLATPLAGMKALRDLTVGVVGFGRIGREVVKRLMPFKCADPGV